MSDRNEFYPSASEKLSYKFILDSLKEDMVQKEGSETHSVGTEISEDSKQCGKVAEPPTLDEQFPEAKLQQETPKPDSTKKYYRIGEVAGLVGVEPYVLRYWESEFSTIRPTKTSTGHRVYSRKDVETLLLIRQLLHVEKFSIKGAKKKLLEKKKENKALAQKSEPDKKALRSIAHELKELIQAAKTQI